MHEAPTNVGNWGGLDVCNLTPADILPQTAKFANLDFDTLTTMCDNYLNWKIDISLFPVEKNVKELILLEP